ELDLLVMKALEKDRSRRYETASSFAADVERYLADEPVQACPPSAAYRLRKFVRRHRGPVLAASLVVLALLIAIVGTTGGMLRAIVAEGKAVNEGKQKELALKDREAALVKAQDRLFLALVNRARAERRSGRVGRRFNALAAIRQAAQIRVTPELRTEAAAALVLPDVEVAQEWEAFPEGSLAVAFDANFQRYVRLDDQGGLTVCRLNAGREEVVARLPAHGKPPFGGPWMSADGRFAAYGHGSPGVGQLSEVRVWKLNGAGSAVLLDDRNGKHQAALAFHPAGRQLAIGHADQSVSVYDLATGQRVHRLAVATAPHHLAFHPHESRLAVAGGSAVQLFDTETGQELPALRHPAAVTWTQSVAWHPAGRRLAVGCNDQKIHVWDTQIGAEIMAPWPSGADGISVNYNAAGDRLMSVDWGGQGLWDAVNGRLLLTIPSYIGPQFSQDDELLGYSTSGTKIQLWRLANGRELRVLRRRNADDRERIQNPVLHGDGRTLAACSEHWLSFFDLASGEELTALRLPRAEAAFPVFFNPPGDSRSPDQGLAGEYAGGWVTAGRSGLFLWPTRPDPASSPVLSVGPPKPLAEGVASWVAHGASASADRRIVAVPQVDHSIVLNRDHPDRRLVLGPQFDVRFTTVSPDGRWVVTCSHWARSKCALIWDAASGEQVHELPLADSTFARFSPDGRWLMTSTVNLGSRLWEVGVWSEVRRYDYARFAFSPDSRLLAIADVYGTIRLVETTTGREVARLTAPEPMWLHPECFTPDGTRLIAASSGFTSLYVWDLRLLRAELKELGLDWNWPEFKPEGGGWPAPLAGPPREIRAAGAELLEAAEHKD
ncbi:MAG TPA: hypothetical protein VFB80_05680, partial [Pirellulaceae bacterium]|nr:hypothetical protein [Pirellulaceae bacterium]